MNYTLPTRAKFACLLMLFFCVNAFAQLPGFTLTVTPTPQTCLGNGSLAFTVSGTNPAATMSYAVYLLPNTTTPLTIVSASTVGGLTAGNYQVVATQSMGGESNTSTATAVILNNVVPLTYTLQPTNVRCGNDGKITVAVTGGTAVSYEIIAGPVTAPLQTSNVFNNLPVGTYQVRVYDNCGEAVVVSIQLIQLNPGFTVALGQIESTVLPSCNTVMVVNEFNVGANLNIFYPLTAQFTVFPPGGGTPIVVTGSATGNSGSGDAVATIPFYHDQQYTYNVVITDACGNTYVRNNNIVNAEIGISAETDFPNCDGALFVLSPTIFVPPFTVDFTDAPAGFNPEDFNTEHPTIAGTSATYGGDNNAVPEGEYTVSITDSCGHTATHTFEVVPPEISPGIVGEAECGSTEGTIAITIQDRLITLVSITAAPDAYEEDLPDDVSVNINAFGAWEMAGLPLGDYTFYIEDACGDTYTQDFTLQPSGGPEGLTIQQRPGCEEGDGSVRILVSNTIVLTQVTITAAPAAFQQPLPYNASANISGTSFNMNSLPEGTYTFSVVDECGITREQQYTLNGYHETQNEFTVLPLCHAFHLQVAHAATAGVNLPSFWLQKYDPVSGSWGHPVNGGTYTEGTLPVNNVNGQLISNNTTNLNILATGDFRVLKVFYVFSNGSTSSTRCIHVIETFTFDDAPQITDAYTFPCSDGLNEVVVVATGVAPLTYSITTKNGEPFAVNNGTSNLFSGLEGATYNFQVTDDCGNIRNIQFDINALNPTEIEAEGFCEGEDSALVIDQFDFLEYEWYEQGNPSVILSTTAVLEFPSFSSTADAGVYVLNITYDANPNSCLNQTMQYEITPNVLPVAGTDGAATVCNDGTTLNLENYLTAPFDANGTWAETTATPSGALTGKQFDTGGLAAGTYTFTYTVSGPCGITDEAVVSLTLKAVPAAPVLSPVSTACEGQDVQLNAETVPGATYSWTGPNGFASALQNPLIVQAAPAASGMYSAYVTVDGCTSAIASVSVTVNAQPQFELQVGTAQLCEGQGTIIGLLPSNFTETQATIAWYQDNAPLGIATTGLEVFEPGEYEAVVTVNGCTASQVVSITLNTNAFDFELEAGCVNENYIISVINLEGITDAQYSWTGPQGFNATGPEIDITRGLAGLYTVTVTSPDGCVVSQDIEIENTWCSIPKGISPNGDEWNNSFDLTNLEVQHLVIYNRYGLKVYEESNYTNQWHGQSTSGDLPTGTYYYVATLSAGLQKTGWVYLQREVR
jgi:gliding motility-associated-like protein